MSFLSTKWLFQDQEGGLCAVDSKNVLSEATGC